MLSFQFPDKNTKKDGGKKHFSFTVTSNPSVNCMEIIICHVYCPIWQGRPAFST